jgi:RNase P subunit RPR2
MALVSSGRSSSEMAYGRPICPRCRAPMWNVRVHAEETGDNKPVVQCPRCEYSYNANSLQKQEFAQSR